MSVHESCWTKTWQNVVIFPKDSIIAKSGSHRLHPPDGQAASV